jgi:tRNA A-37 threonylcarbamoyl transferase component Bud32
VELPLKQKFCYVHEPMRPGETAIPLLGNAQLVTDLRNRILHSRGGAFLVTGFRGVGKSTVVLRALEELENADGDQVVVPVFISVARTMEVDRLLFAIIRRVFESLHDLGYVDRLSDDARESLVLAYRRTSLTLNESRTDSTQKGGAVNASVGAGKVAPGISYSRQRTRSLVAEAQFMAYAETDVEHDISRIVARLQRDGAMPDLRRTGWRGWTGRKSSKSSAKIRLAIVLDEVDKITEDADGISAVEAILGAVKNILTMRGVHFVMVAGPELHDRVVSDMARGNSVYESVFGWRAYVPCSWDAVDILLSDVLDEAPDPWPAELLAFRDYLRFKARGIPRRLLQEFNEFVAWREHGPVLCVNSLDARKVSFYSRIEEILDEYREQDKRSAGLFPLAVDEDRRRLGDYYVIDWVLGSKGREFTAADLVNSERDTRLAPVLHVSQASAERLLSHLAARKIVEVVRKPGATQTLIGEAGEQNIITYRLADDIIQVLLSLADRSEEERAALAVPAPTAGGSGLPQVIAGRYEIVRTLGSGGMGRVFLGRDRILGRVVAIKSLHDSEHNDVIFIERLRREASITSQLEHPHIVRCYDIIERRDSFALILEFVDGRTLSELVSSSGALTASETVSVAQGIAEALEYLEEQRIVRIDLKPSNVMIHPTRGPILIDFGIAKPLNLPTITSTGVLIGTPAYMAPEQLEGRPGDHRADIHALAAVMYYCLTGQNPWQAGDSSMTGMIAQMLMVEMDVSHLPASEALRAVIARAGRISPDERYQHASELLAALEKTPEAAVSAAPLRKLWDSQVDVEFEANFDKTQHVPRNPTKLDSSAGGDEQDAVPPPWPMRWDGDPLATAD